MSKPRLLDLFCGAGGCARGYVEAGFDVTGVDHRPQRRYLFSGASRFVQADAFEYLRRHGREYDAIHASPPCQRYSVTRRLPNVRKDHPDLYASTRETLVLTGKLWIIENVYGAPYDHPFVLCGLMFGLKVFRHRYFESPGLILVPDHPAHRGIKIGVDGMVCVAGHGSSSSYFKKDGSRRKVPADHRTVAAWRRGMGIDWMTRCELSQAIPPAYTFWIGRQLIQSL